MSNKVVYLGLAVFIAVFWGTVFYVAWRYSAAVKPAVTDEHCPYCHGLGYDSSGWTCTCLREKK